MNSTIKSKNAIKNLNWENIGNINHGGLFGLKVQDEGKYNFCAHK